MVNHINFDKGLFKGSRESPPDRKQQPSSSPSVRDRNGMLALTGISDESSKKS